MKTNQEYNPLLAISPIDGRYKDKCGVLTDIFSEYAFIKYRFQIEILYFLELCKKGIVCTKKEEAILLKKLEEKIKTFSLEDAKQVKQYEEKTQHDVKAIEYFIKNQFEIIGLKNYSSWIHYGLTSQDVNSLAVSLMMVDAVKLGLLPMLKKLISTLKSLSQANKQVVMMGRTHGQAASPTLLGKEIYVFVYRLEKQLKKLNAIQLTAKFGGAVGNLNAHQLALGSVDWIQFMKNFVKQLGIKRSAFTTQVDNNDSLSELFGIINRLNLICIDLSRDIWLYISFAYFKQTTTSTQIGSSTMPHKVNPIDFENAEGNLEIANHLLTLFIHKFPISRLQRDLSDSTVMRNIGVALGHCLIAYTSLKKGLSKLQTDKEKIEKELMEHWEIISEGIQTILRREKVENSYEIVQKYVKDKRTLNQKDIKTLIDQIPVSEKIKEELYKISPKNYIGIYNSKIK